MTEPTDAELDELRQANSGKLNFVTFSEFRTIARAVLAKWGSQQPVAPIHDLGFIIEQRAGVDVLVWDKGGCRPATSTEIAMWHSLAASLQPTQAQAGTPCRKNPFYHGPRNCIRGTVGCCEDHGTATQAQAGAMPLTDEQIRAMCKEPWVFETAKQWVRITEQHHGITGGQHG